MGDYLPRPEGIDEMEWQYFLNSDVNHMNPVIRDKVKLAMDTPAYREAAIEATTRHYEKLMEGKSDR
jgi:hypothetical protein